MPQDLFGLGARLRKLMGEAEQVKPQPMSAKEAADRKAATDKAIGPRYKVHDASATDKPKGSVTAIPKKAEKKPGTIRNIAVKNGR